MEILKTLKKLLAAGDTIVKVQGKTKNGYDGVHVALSSGKIYEIQCKTLDEALDLYRTIVKLAETKLGGV